MYKCQYFFNFTACSFLRKSRQQKQANNLNKTYMNINYKSMQEASPYETPTVKTLDILSEGVLCSSGEFEAPDWGEGQNNWFE